MTAGAFLSSIIFQEMMADAIFLVGNNGLKVYIFHASENVALHERIRFL